MSKPRYGIKVALIRPGYKSDASFFGPMESLGIGYLHAVLTRSGHEVEIIDGCLEELDVPEIVRRVSSFDPHLIGFTTTEDDSKYEMFRVAAAIRGSGIRSHMTAGGYFATFWYEEILKRFAEFNSVIRGEGEPAMVELAGRLGRGEDWSDVPGLATVREGQVRYSPGNPVEDLDSLPFPTRYFPVRGTISVYSSRGCYGRCNYCSIHRFYSLTGTPGWRCRSPSNVVDEIAQLIDKYGVRHFTFNDDNFIGGHRGRGRAYGIADEILERNIKIKYYIQCRTSDVDMELFKYLKESGLRGVGIGVESWKQKDLDYLNKGVGAEVNMRAYEDLKRLGIFAQAYFIYGHPETTLEDIREHHRQNKKLGLYQQGLTYTSLGGILIPYKGTAIFERLKAEGLVTYDPDKFTVALIFKDARVNKFVNYYGHIKYYDRKLWYDMVNKYKPYLSDENNRLTKFLWMCGLIFNDYIGGSINLMTDRLLDVAERPGNAEAEKILKEYMLIQGRADHYLESIEEDLRDDREKYRLFRLGEKRYLFCMKRHFMAELSPDLYSYIFNMRDGTNITMAGSQALNDRDGALGDEFNELSRHINSPQFVPDNIYAYIEP